MAAYLPGKTGICWQLNHYYPAYYELQLLLTSQSLYASFTPISLPVKFIVRLIALSLLLRAFRKLEERDNYSEVYHNHLLQSLALSSIFGPLLYSY